MIRLSGLSVRDEAAPDGDIEILEVGLRPGEKLYEELLIGGDPAPTAHARIMQARETVVPWGTLSLVLDELRGALGRGDSEASILMLQKLVPEYSRLEVA
jgi:FlaA1/EpsC-like NDP-sugar epimerase